MKTNIFYAMNEIDDKYILEAAQCLEHKNTGRNYRLNRDKCLNNKWMTHIVAAILIIVFVFTTKMILSWQTVYSFPTKIKKVLLLDSSSYFRLFEP